MAEVGVKAPTDLAPEGKGPIYHLSVNDVYEDYSDSMDGLGPFVSNSIDSLERRRLLASYHLIDVVNTGYPIPDSALDGNFVKSIRAFIRKAKRINNECRIEDLQIEDGECHECSILLPCIIGWLPEDESQENQEQAIQIVKAWETLFHPVLVIKPLELANGVAEVPTSTTY